MLTRQEIEQWHDPPSIEQAKWLLELADGFIGSRPGNEEIVLSHVATPDLSSPEFFREKAEQCLALSYEIVDPKKQVAILKFASWWMRIAEQYVSKGAHRRKM
jgi:hypothetical protein